MFAFRIYGTGLDPKPPFVTTSEWNELATKTDRSCLFGIGPGDGRWSTCDGTRFRNHDVRQ